LRANAASCAAVGGKQITGYAMMKGWTVAEFFVEGGVSGSTPPEGKRLLETAKVPERRSPMRPPVATGLTPTMRRHGSSDCRHSKR
jgi:hypothetical protein